MTTIQRVARNTAVLFSAQALNYLLAFFYMMYTARYLGVAGFGVLSFAIALAAIFGLLADLGLRTLTVREVARDKSLASKYVVNVTLIKVALAAVTFGLIALSVNLMGYPPQAVKVVYLLGLSVITLAFTQVFYSIFQAFERMEYISVGQVLNASLMLVGVILAMHYGLSIVGFALLFLLARAVELVYAVAVLKFKFAGQPAFSRAKTFEIDPAFWKQSLRAAWPMGAMAIGIMIYFRIDTEMPSVGDTTLPWGYTTQVTG